MGAIQAQQRVARNCIAAYAAAARGEAGDWGYWGVARSQLAQGGGTWKAQGLACAGASSTDARAARLSSDAPLLLF